MIAVHLVRRDGLGCVRFPIRPCEPWQDSLVRHMFAGASVALANLTWRLWRTEAWTPGPCDGRCRVDHGEEDEDHG